MADDSELDRTIAPLIALAQEVLRGSASADTVQDVSEEDWGALLDRIPAQARQNGLGLPLGWQEALTRYRDRQRLRADVDNTRLAEQGEVFSREDDA
ncbi:hypothetical protein [Methylobacterium gnaphalii]|uniref:Uncharacterized protein n=1 Tax=Methylobacterium gnaphalii TaxID=1010610 RepID=A0A512JGV9_9HYPH|nr:hypothetical protein [Methylobacterium gnaphalii]GEP09200.1 hypothetical protein MGN01_10450 [Methylobacterium gnaphalii]GJD67612.1 hypothetical protein MMMDOFMJ_0528 [Methylobacterium gnaphalii]GLS50523.1 hypothetical protein GCM10007885_33750 [Methylobacterium gnaphalii]